MHTDIQTYRQMCRDRLQTDSHACAHTCIHTRVGFEEMLIWPNPSDPNGRVFLKQLISEIHSLLVKVIVKGVYKNKIKDILNAMMTIIIRIIRIMAIIRTIIIIRIIIIMRIIIITNNNNNINNNNHLRCQLM